VIKARGVRERKKEGRVDDKKKKKEGYTGVRGTFGDRMSLY